MKRSSYHRRCIKDFGAEADLSLLSAEREQGIGSSERPHACLPSPVLWSLAGVYLAASALLAHRVGEPACPGTKLQSVIPAVIQFMALLTFPCTLLLGHPLPYALRLPLWFAF